MKNEKKVRELIKPQKFDQKAFNESLAVPYCGSGYTTTGDSTSCSSGYSSNMWCTSSPTEEDEVLF
jgi:hypothetical protein